MMDPMLIPLRDIHGLDPVSWWPPAPGWWLLVALLVGLGALLWWLRRHWPRQWWWGSNWRVAARGELFLLRRRLYRDDPKLVAQSLSELLRRIAIARCGRKSCAGLSGPEWLAWLEGHDPRDFPWRRDGKLLVSLPYAPSGRLEDMKALGVLVRAAEAWVAPRCPLPAQAAAPGRAASALAAVRGVLRV
jgi:hypothetical protein